MKQYLLMVSFFCAVTGKTQVIEEAYQTYDFQPGETTLFEDRFNYAANEKIEDHWQFLDGGGAASIRQFNGESVLSFDAYYTRLRPKLFGNQNLPGDFTIEYDAWLDPAYDSNLGVYIGFELADGSRLPMIEPSRDRLRVVLPNNETVSMDNPAEYYESRFFNRWVHFSISLHDKILKVYLDQYKLIEITDILETPVFMIVNGDKMGEAGNGETPIYLKNFRVATGFPAVLFENGKFITRNIKFDVNKSVLKPESITTIKQVKSYLDKNPTVRVEIAGHTDSDGAEEANLKLSQERADAVKNQLVSMGISADRLMTKGYGELQPLDKRETPEAKANNRRVEFSILPN